MKVHVGIEQLMIKRMKDLMRWNCMKYSQFMEKSLK